MNSIFTLWMDSYGWINPYCYIGLRPESKGVSDLYDKFFPNSQSFVGCIYEPTFLIPQLDGTLIEWPSGLYCYFYINDKREYLSTFELSPMDELLHLQDMSFSIPQGQSAAFLRQITEALNKLQDTLADIYLEIIKRSIEERDSLYQYLNRYSIKDKTIVIDLDGTLSFPVWDKSAEESFANPYHKAEISKTVSGFIKEAISRNFNIVFYTTREIKYYYITQYWLYRKGMSPFTLTYVKPDGFMYIDDRMVSPEELSFTMLDNQKGKTLYGYKTL